MIEVRYNLNMVPDKGSPIHINVSQNDDKCRTFIFKLYSSDGSWTAPASATATIEGRKDDGKFFSFACTYSSGEVTVIVQQQMVAVAGKVRCKLKLVSGAETIESAPFYFVVNPKSMPVNADMSKSDIVDAVAKATQKIVDQVAGSIPQDYVKLNEDVSGLKESTLSKLYDGKWIAESYINGDTGEFSLFTGNNYHYSTEYIPVFKDTIIHFTKTVGTLGYDGYAFYDADKKVVTSSRWLQHGTVEYNLEVPEGAYWFRTSVTDKKEIQLYTVHEMVSTIAENTSNISKHTVNIDQNMYKVDVMNSVLFNHSIDRIDTSIYYSDETRFLTSKGDPIKNQYCENGDRVYEPIPVIVGNTYIINTYYKDGRGYQLLDENKSVVRFIAAGTGKIVTTLSIIIPEGIHYLRIGCNIKKATLQIYTFSTSAIAENTSAIAENTSAIAENTKIIKNPNGIKIILSDKYINGNNFIGSKDSVNNGFEGDKATDYIKITPNTKYLYSGHMTDGRGYALYDEEKKGIFYTNAYALNPKTHVVNTFEFITPSNAKYARFSVYGNKYHSDAYIQEMGTNVRDWIYTLEKRIGAKDMSVDTYVPNIIYAIDNDSSKFYGRDYVQSVYPEGIIGNNVAASINGSKRLLLQKNSNNINLVEDTQISFTITGKDIIDKTISTMSLRKVKASVAKGKTIRCLSIGDSITANRIPEYDGVFRGPVCYMSVMDLLSKLNAIDFSDKTIQYIPLGTSNKYENTYSYKKTTVSVKNIGEGRGSWTTADYLRHPMSMCGKGDPTESYSNQSKGKATWDLLGLGTKQSMDIIYDVTAEYTAFVADNEHYDIIRMTPMGYYHWDYTEDVWEWCKKRNSVLTSGSWSASDAQKQIVDAICEDLLENPVNPFFDKNDAKSGNIAFNISTYLKRYKTLEDDGITRLSVGSTSGTKVTNITAYDVCTPTHIIIELGENDRWWYSDSYEKTTDDVIKLMDTIHKDIPDVFIGFITTRTVGIRDASQWIDYAYDENTELSYYKFNLNRSVALNVDPAKKEYCIPTYATHSPISCQTARKDIDLIDGSEKVIVGSDSVHPGIWAYWAMGYQILAWIYYTLTL